MENGAFAPFSIFHNIFKYIVFQRGQKLLSWSKGLGCPLSKFKDNNLMQNSVKSFNIFLAKLLVPFE